MKLAVPDMISNSYFPALAAAELGFFAREGLDVSVELIFPVNKAYEALRDGEIELVAGSAHSMLAAFPEWKGGKLLCAQAQGMYWFLVVRSDLWNADEGVHVLKGRKIGAAPWVDFGLRALLLEEGLDVERDNIQITPVPGTGQGGVNFGVAAAAALERGDIDAFWANGMGAEVAVSAGSGKVIRDVRREGAARNPFHFTFASIATTDRLVAQEPERVASVVRAIVATQRALRNDVTLADTVGNALFPPEQAKLITRLIERDLPFYDAAISHASVTGMNAFARRAGLLERDHPYDDVVAGEFSSLWVTGK
ncbi:ABC-type nitrate/sulfonate/bicarbonate transport system, substrate-binding protein [Burkholderia sp. OK233]|nr:ABC-type nitrate/sulfonate/bicarbonate transport system, substrate-binding protein [Burkholderia sp. OK233]